MTEQELPKVLIVEDLAYEQDKYQRGLEGVAKILPASSIEEGRQLFLQNPDIKLIVMDACVPGDVPTTQSLVREFRNTFTGPMIAASSISQYRRQLTTVGCDHESEKRAVPLLVKTLLAKMAAADQSTETAPQDKEINLAEKHPGLLSQKAAESKGTGFGEMNAG